MKLNNSISRNSRSAGFTLLEMVIVMAIMGILAGGVIALIGGVQDNARATKAEQVISTYVSNLELYHSRAKKYPTTEQGLEALVKKPTSSPVPRKWQATMQELQTDPWGQAYSYKCSDGRYYTITSAGADQQLGTDDDIVHDSKPAN